MWSVMMFVEVSKLPGASCLMLPMTLSHCLSALGKEVWLFWLSRPNTVVSQDGISVLKIICSPSWTFLLSLFKNKTKQKPTHQKTCSLCDVCL